MLRDVSAERTVVLIRRPDVNVIVRKEKDIASQEKDCKDGLDDNKDVIISAYK